MHTEAAAEELHDRRFSDLCHRLQTAAEPSAAELVQSGRRRAPIAYNALQQLVGILTDLDKSVKRAPSAWSSYHERFVVAHNQAARLDSLCLSLH